MGCRIHKKKNIYKKNLRGLLSQPQAYYRPWIGHWWKFIWFSMAIPKHAVTMAGSKERYFY